MKIVAIVQARMTSSRYPGKVLRPLVGRPLLWHIVNRVRRAESVHCVVVACSMRLEDDAIEQFCREQGILVIRGSEENVLERFGAAMERYPADYYVRICGDSPLVAPPWIDRCVRAIQAGRGDYTVVNKTQLCAHEGVDVISRRALRRLLLEAAGDPVAREHVTGYLKLNPEFGRKVEVNVPDAEQAEARLSVDMPEDLAFFEQLYALTGAPVGALSMEAALGALRQYPELRTINACVRQRAADERPKKVLLYGEGGGEVGWGHLARLEVMARSLRHAGADVVFAYDGGVEVDSFVKANDLIGRNFAGHGDRGRWLAAQVVSDRIDVVVVDTCGRFSENDMKTLRAVGRPIVLIDDTSERTLFADAVFNPPAPQSKSVRPGFVGEWKAGWDCVPLRPEFLRDYSDCGDQTLLVTMGGSDPLNFTCRALEALKGVPGASEWRIRVVLGPTFAHREELEQRMVSTTLRIELVNTTRNMAGEMANARGVLLAFGVTAYEAAALGRPMACFCLSDDHRQHASVFAEDGLAVVLANDPLQDAAILGRWLKSGPSSPRGSNVDKLKLGTPAITRHILGWAGKRFV